MWVRSGMWIGNPRDGESDRFEMEIEQALLPAMRRLPGVSSVMALWPRRHEDGPPDIHCQILVHFETLADLDGMLKSEERAALRPKVREIAALFDGRISHIDYQVLPAEPVSI